MNDVIWFALCLVLLVTVVLLTRRLTASHRKSDSIPVDGSSIEEAPASAGAPLAGTGEILERMGEGVLLLDRDMRPVFSNSVARAMLGFQRASLPTTLPSEEIVTTARHARIQGEVEEVLHLRFPRPIDLRVRATLLDQENGVLVVLQDVTQEVLTQRIRREFVAHASHELKSPVASLQTLAEAVQQAVDDDPEAVAHFSRRMASEADRLGRLVADLLDLSRLEDPIDIPREPADLSDIARGEVDDIRAAGEAKGVVLDERIDPGVWLKGDEQLLGLLVKNLLENAIRYTPSDGKVTLEVFRKELEAFVRVSDDGIGIPREAHGRVFERFYRVDRARSRDQGGTGLGLAIVKHVAEMHGGGVSLSSDLGEGSIFTVRLPAMDTGVSDGPVESLAG